MHSLTVGFLCVCVCPCRDKERVCARKREQEREKAEIRLQKMIVYVNMYMIFWTSSVRMRVFYRIQELLGESDYHTLFMSS